MTRADIDRLGHWDAAHLIHDMRELCRIHDLLIDAALAKTDPPGDTKKVVPLVHMPFRSQNIEVLRWALILRGDPALDEVAAALCAADLAEASFVRELIETLTKWRSEKATAALVDFGADLAERDDVDRGILHLVVAGLFYWHSSEENLRAFVHGERIRKVRRIVVRFAGLGGASGVHVRFFNSFFPEQSIDPAGVGGKG